MNTKPKRIRHKNPAYREENPELSRTKVRAQKKTKHRTKKNWTPAYREEKAKPNWKRKLSRSGSSSSFSLYIMYTYMFYILIPSVGLQLKI